MTNESEFWKEYHKEHPETKKPKTLIKSFYRGDITKIQLDLLIAICDTLYIDHESIIERYYIKDE